MPDIASESFVYDVLGYLIVFRIRGWLVLTSWRELRWNLAGADTMFVQKTVHRLKMYNNAKYDFAN